MNKSLSTIVLALALSVSLVFPAEVLCSTGAETVQSTISLTSILGGTTVKEAKLNFKTTCGSTVIEPVTCGGVEAEQSLETAMTTSVVSAAASLAGGAASAVGSITGDSTTSTTGMAVGAAGSVSSMAGSAIACSQIKCDTGTSANEACVGTCQASCLAGSATCAANATIECIGSLVAEAVCQPAAQKKCEADKCVPACTEDGKADDLKRDNTIPVGEFSQIYGIATSYGTCIQEGKAQAKLLQQKCRSMCRSAAQQAASAYMLAATAVGVAGAVVGAVTGKSDGTGSTGGTSSDTGTGTVRSSSSNTCSGLTGEPLSICACNMVSGKWENGKCLESTGTGEETGASKGGSLSYTGLELGSKTGSATNEAGDGKGRSVSGTGSTASGTGLLSGVGQAPSGTGTGKAQEGMTSAPDGRALALTGQGKADGTDSSTVVEGSSTWEEEGSSEGKLPEIINKNEDLFATVTHIYNKKYTNEELGLLTLKSDKPSKEAKKAVKTSVKKKGARTRSTLK